MSPRPTEADPVTLALTAPAPTWSMVAEGLAALAEQRRRAAISAAGELELERLGGRDIRTGSTRVVRVLAEADTFGRIAGVIRSTLGEAPDADAATPAGALELPPETSPADVAAAEATLAGLEAAVSAARAPATNGDRPSPAGLDPRPVYVPDVDAVLAATGPEPGVLDA